MLMSTATGRDSDYIDKVDKVFMQASTLRKLGTFLCYFVYYSLKHGDIISTAKVISPKANQLWQTVRFRCSRK